jgi:hypothetical protein
MTTMVTVEELERAHEMVRALGEMKAQLEEELGSAKQRKLETVGDHAWDKRVEELDRAVALLSEAQRRIEGAWS